MLVRVATSFIVVSIALLVAFGSGARAESNAASGHFSASISLTSDYRYLGQSQTNRGFAVQGSVDYKSASGLFASVWISSIKLGDPKNAAPELDFSAGYSYSISEDTRVTSTLLYYWYPASAGTHYDYSEISFAASHDFGTVLVDAEVTYSPDFSDDGGVGVGTLVGLDIPVATAGSTRVSASGHVGFQSVANSAAYGTPNWLYYDFGLTATWKMFDIDVRYTGTNISRARCFGGTDFCAGGVAMSLTANIPVD